MLKVDSAGKKMPSEEDVSELLNKLKVSPGGGTSATATAQSALDSLMSRTPLGP